MKNTKNNVTELVFILDRSGSMAGLESDTVGGFNSMLKKQKGEDGRCFVSTVLFDSDSKVLHDRLPIEDIEEMTDRDFCVGGCTALLDALGGAIHHVGNIHKYARKEDVPDNTVFVIMTDGHENASKRYDGPSVKKMIERQREKYGWEFLFLGANIDAAATARTYGIDEDRAVNYHADSKGTRLNYEATACAISAVRCGKSIPKGWRKEIDRDFKERSKNS